MKKKKTKVENSTNSVFVDVNSLLVAIFEPILKAQFIIRKFAAS